MRIFFCVLSSKQAISSVILLTPVSSSSLVPISVMSSAKSDRLILTLIASYLYFSLRPASGSLSQGNPSPFDSDLHVPSLCHLNSTSLCYFYYCLVIYVAEDRGYLSSFSQAPLQGPLLTLSILSPDVVCRSLVRSCIVSRNFPSRPYFCNIPHWAGLFIHHILLHSHHYLCCICC